MNCVEKKRKTRIMKSLISIQEFVITEELLRRTDETWLIESVWKIQEILETWDKTRDRGLKERVSVSISWFFFAFFLMSDYKKLFLVYCIFCKRSTVSTPLGPSWPIRSDRTFRVTSLVWRNMCWRRTGKQKCFYMTCELTRNIYANFVCDPFG